MTQTLLREELYTIAKHKDYIIDCSKGFIYEVYQRTILFNKSYSNEFTWANMEGYPLSRENEDSILAAVNGLCGTKFEFVD